jgi:hypothetical protein
MRVVEPFLHLRRVGAESLRRHLHGGLHSAHCRIFAHEPDFVYPDARVTFQGCAHLFGERSSRGRTASSPHRKRTDKPRQGRLRALRSKHDAGDARAREHLREAFLCCCRFQRHPVQVKLVAMRPEQEAATGLGLQNGT